MKYFEKITAVILAVFISVSVLPFTASAAVNHQKYWALQAAYNTALDSKNEDAIIKACEDIFTLYAGLEDDTSCYRVITPILNAVKIYEARGDYQNALRLYKLYQRCYQTLDRLTDSDVSEALRYADAFIDAYSYTEPEVYVHANDPADVPYYGAKNEPELGTYIGMCGEEYDETLSNAYLLYVRFEDETIYGFSYMLPDTDQYYMLELAWNIPDHYTENGAIEYLDGIASGKHDAYIIENLKYLGTLENCGILLRFGAEVNVWGVNTAYAQSGRLEKFKATFKSAFRHIHDLAEQYAPNAAMVYSPVDGSNMYVTYDDFYPGDEYVDWVGLSSYENQSAQASGQYGNMNDAFYKIGVYTNQMARIKAFVELYGDRKPVMISECGFMYKSAVSKQDEAFAKDRLKYFYSYINMVYPQVKAVFYFNTNFGGNEYRLFGEGSGNEAVADVYRKTTNNNLVMSRLLNGNATGYTRLSTLNEKRDDLTLSVYAAYPGNPDMTVKYILDGKTVAAVSEVPYTANIGKSLLAEGRHTLSVVTSVGKTVYTNDYVIYVSSDGVVRASEPDMTDVVQNHWAYPYIAYCIQEGFFEGLVSAEFLPTSKVNRAMFVTLLGRAAGIDPEDYGSSGFSDVSDGAYYAPYVTWAREAGVTAGTSETTFSPDMIITREQICTMLVRYCDNSGIELPEADSQLFADDAKIEAWYKDGVYTAKAAGIVSGRGNNIFDPDADLNRQEICVILKSFHEKYIVAKP